MKPLSPSQLSTFKMCKRRWHGVYRQGRRTPPAASAREGTAAHKLLENFVKDGVEIPLSQTDVFGGKEFATGAIAGAMAAHFEDTEGASTEHTFEFEAGGLLFGGIIDLLTPSTVTDYKTTSDFKYAKNQDQLLTDIQRVVYSRYRDDDHDALWIYGRTRGEPKSRKVRLRVLRDETREIFDREILPLAREIMAVPEGIAFLDLPPTLETSTVKSCSLYPPDGCPFVADCGITAMEKIMSGLKKKSLLETLREEFDKSAPAPEHRVLVCGGRDFADKSQLFDELNKLHAERPITQIIHGGAKGADTLAGLWGETYSVPVRVFPADWDTFGKSAGPVRNKQMLVEGKPDLVVAFKGGAGTLNMRVTAQVAGVPIKAIEGRPTTTQVDGQTCPVILPSSGSVAVDIAQGTESSFQGKIALAESLAGVDLGGINSPPMPVTELSPSAFAKVQELVNEPPEPGSALVDAVRLHTEAPKKRGRPKKEAPAPQAEIVLQEEAVVAGAKLSVDGVLSVDRVLAVATPRPIGTLYVNCFIINEHMTQASDLIATAAEEVCADAQVLFHTMVDFGKGPGMVAAQVKHNVSKMPRIEHLYLNTRGREGGDILQTLTTLADRIVMGV